MNNTEFLENAKRIILDNLSDCDFTPNKLSQQLYVSRSQLHRKLVALTNQNTSEFIRNIRLEKAADLLNNAEVLVTRVALETGFNNFSWFTKCFKERYGGTPSDFKKKLIEF